MLVIAWRRAAAPRAALAALSLASVVSLGDEVAPPPPAVDATSLLAVGYTPQRAPRAALANLYSNVTPGDLSSAPPEVTPAVDATALLVVGYTPARSPRAAFAQTLGGQVPGDLSTAAAPVVPESITGTPRVPAGGWNRRAPQAAIANLYRWRAAFEDEEPYPDATAITVIAWRTQRTTRAQFLQVLGGQVPGDLSTAPPPVEPESVGGIPRIIRWDRRAPRAAIATLYGNVTPGDLSSAPPVVEPAVDATSLLVVGWTPTRIPRAAFLQTVSARVPGDLSTAPPPVEPESITGVARVPRGGWVRLTPRAALQLYRNLSPWDGDGPVPEVPPVITYVDFLATAHRVDIEDTAHRVAVELIAERVDVAAQATGVAVDLTAQRVDIEETSG